MSVKATRRPVAVALAAVALLPLLAAGCDVPATPMPPYRLGDPRIDSDGLTLLFLLENATSREISRLSVSCLVSERSEPIAIPVDAELPVEITAGASHEVSIDLSEVTWHTPRGSRSVDQLHVYRIVYSDGGEWRDRFGLYVLPGTIE